MSDPTYPSEEDLTLKGVECRLPPSFVAPSQEPGLLFSPRVAEYRLLTISNTKPTTPPHPTLTKSYDFVSYAGRDENLNSEEDVKDFLRLIMKDSDTIAKLFKTLDDKHKIEKGGPIFKFGFAQSSTPYDIDITQQCYVVLILDPRVNWRFQPNGRGVTTKAYYGADNFGVTFATRAKGEEPGPSDVIFTRPEICFGAPHDCRALYFAAARRRNDSLPPTKGFNSRQSFNFYMEFIWEPTKIGNVHYPERTMPTIFDPDVPNSGGSSLP